jgi:hypothetical protein
MKARPKNTGEVIDGAPVRDEANPPPWLPVATDHEELWDFLVGKLEPLKPAHFLRPCDNDPTLVAAATAVCKVLGSPRPLFGEKIKPREGLEDIFWKALSQRRADVFEMFARGLAKQGNDNRAVVGCLEAIEALGRVPSTAEVLEVLKNRGTPMTIRTLTRHLRRHRLRLPQRGKSSIAPRRPSR